MLLLSATHKAGTPHLHVGVGLQYSPLALRYAVGPTAVSQDAVLTMGRKHYYGTAVAPGTDEMSMTLCLQPRFARSRHENYLGRYPATGSRGYLPKLDKVGATALLHYLFERSS